MNIYLIRHGKTIDAVNDITQNEFSDLHKDHLGLLENTKNFLKEVQFDYIYSSPYKRTKSTAKILFENRDYEVLDYIYEYIGPKEHQGKNREYKRIYWEVTYKDDKYLSDWKPGEGESFNEILIRVDRLIYLLKRQKNNNIAVIGHGGFFMHFLGRVLFRDLYTPKIYHDFLLHNFSVNNGGFYKYILKDQEIHFESMVRNEK